MASNRFLDSDDLGCRLIFIDERLADQESAEFGMSRAQMREHGRANRRIDDHDGSLGTSRFDPEYVRDPESRVQALDGVQDDVALLLGPSDHAMELGIASVGLDAAALHDHRP